ncbi:MAG: hypothetical protein ACYTGH_15460, partial [Planctomycetota bacterium]
MSIPILRSILTALSLLLLTTGAHSQESTPLKGATYQKKFPYHKQAAKNPNLCPVCGKSWNISIKDHDKKKPLQDPHEKCFLVTNPEKERVNCPSCGLKLQINK